MDGSFYRALRGPSWDRTRRVLKAKKVLLLLLLHFPAIHPVALEGSTKHVNNSLYPRHTSSSEGGESSDKQSWPAPRAPDTLRMTPDPAMHALLVMAQERGGHDWLTDLAVQALTEELKLGHVTSLCFVCASMLSRIPRTPPRTYLNREQLHISAVSG